MTQLTVTATINAPLTKVRLSWTTPADIMQRNFASDDRECPAAENNLVIGGTFKARMAAKDGSAAFDFEGIYTDIIENSLIAYKLEDDRKVSITFTENNSQTVVTETFDPENENPLEMQQAGRQAILDNFKKYVENN